MFEARERDDVTVIVGQQELTKEDLAEIARIARAARHAGRRVVVDLKRVDHLHYAGAALLKSVPDLKAAGASRYVRDLVAAGGAGAHVEHFDDVEEATQAA
ncbi:MAG: anti-anti-sigma factor [Anaeromyxobacteraceae bacterium]